MQEWTPPDLGYLKLSFDGSSLGNPGISGFGGVISDHSGNKLFTYAGPLDISDSTFAELQALLAGLRVFKDKCRAPLQVEGDSKVVIEWCENTSSPPWRHWDTFKEILDITSIVSCCWTHIPRSANSAADVLAREGTTLQSLVAKRLLLDPAIHEESTRLKNLVEEKDKKVKELQDNIAAVNFTPSSKMGKMLMAKCRTLQQENEEIGQLHSEGKIHELSMKLALQKSQNAELRTQFEGLCKYMEGLIDDMEKSNEIGLILQQKMTEKDSELTKLKEKLVLKVVAEGGKYLVIDKKAIDEEAIVEIELV